MVHRYRLDGIKYDRCVDTSTGALPFRLDLQTEFPKMALTRTLIDGRAEDFPEDLLTAEEEVSEQTPSTEILSIVRVITVCSSLDALLLREHDLPE